MTITTILSRFERKQSKYYDTKKLQEKIKECTDMAVKWIVIGNNEQANRFWDAVEFYKKLLTKNKQ
jgi:hypothetical protein